MFFMNESILWTFHIFLILTYVLFVVSLIIYLIPIINNNNQLIINKKSLFNFINSFDFLFILITPLFLVYTLNSIWYSSVLSIWFGHLILTTFSFKIIYLNLFTMSLVLIIYSTNFYFSSKEIYDYIIINYNFLYWLIIIFFVNTIFTLIFIIEVLSALLFLLIISSTFSTTFFYNNSNIKNGHYINQIIPNSYIQSLLFFFWVSLISSLNLFLFIIFLYYKLYTFDWYLLENIFIYYINISSQKEIIVLSLIWIILLFSVFLKCGIVPFFFWKPTFFKGIPFYTLFFYIIYFYFFLFLYFINFLNTYFSEIFYFFFIVIYLFVLLGVLVLLTIICETFYIKSFLAISSILNSIFVIIAFSSVNNVNIIFLI